MTEVFGTILVIYFVISAIIAIWRVTDRSSIVKKHFKELNNSVQSGLMDDKIIEMAKQGNYAIYGFVSSFIYEAKEKAEYELEDKGLDTDSFNREHEFTIKDAEKELEKILKKRFEILNIIMDEYEICSL